MPDIDTAAREAEYNARLARWASRLTDTTGLTPDQEQGFACVACGYSSLSRPEGEMPKPMVVVGYGRVGVSSHLFACVPCDRALTYTPAAEEDPETTPLEALAALAEDLTREGLPEYARRARVIATRLGHLVDEIRGDVLMLTGYAPGVNDTARAKGDQALRAIGDAR